MQDVVFFNEGIPFCHLLQVLKCLELRQPAMLLDEGDQVSTSAELSNNVNVIFSHEDIVAV